MIDRVERALWRLQRSMSQSEWTARLLHTPPPPVAGAGRGLVMVQIDGLSRAALARAIADGRMPFLDHLVANEGYGSHRMYSGLPSSTPAVQAELFYGVPLAVPAYAFVDRRTGVLMRMWQHETAAGVERRMADHRALLQGGSSYCNIYRGGAAEARFCMASLGWTDPFRTRHPLALPPLVVLYGGDVLRMAVLVARELLAAPRELVAALARGQDFLSELKFTASRIAVAVVLRELIALSATIDIARGLPVVYLNLIGYDECAHRRGPASALASDTLREIDNVVGRMVRAARRSGRRGYEVWVLSDHGQEETVPYVEHYGRSVHEAVAEVFRAYGTESQTVHEPWHGVQGQRARLIGQRLGRLVAPGLDHVRGHREPGRVVVTAQGPLGHVYTPKPLEEERRDAIAAALVLDAAIPLVLAADDPGTARAWTGLGTWSLPKDAASVLGADHPYLSAAAQDLVDLCHHRDAGDLVISGWQPDAPAISFPHENGSHGGPGPAETDAFVLVPSERPLAPAGKGPLRAADLRRAALAWLDGVGERCSSSGRALPPRVPDTVRLVTYNVHSCIGLDGVLSLERVAGVIAHCDPDVVALQELDVGRPRTGGVDQARAIADRLQMLLHFHPSLSVGEERYGDAVLSRLPMRVERAARLPRRPRRRPLEPRGAIWVEIGARPSTLQLVNTHLSLDPVERGAQVEALLGPEWMGAIPAGEAVLCGDFNALAWFPVCRRITRNLSDAQAGRVGHRPRPTWPGGIQWGRIDHVFVDPAITVSAVAVDDDPVARVASDHLPLIVDLQLPLRKATG